MDAIHSAVVIKHTLLSYPIPGDIPLARVSLYMKQVNDVIRHDDDDHDHVT